MKRLIALVLVLAMAFSLAACGHMKPHTKHNPKHHVSVKPVKPEPEEQEKPVEPDHQEPEESVEPAPEPEPEKPEEPVEPEEPETPDPEEPIEPEPEEPEEPVEPEEPIAPENPSEAYEYYKENTEIKKVIKVIDSQDVQAEEDVKLSLESRGFAQYPIFYDNTMDGTFVDETEIDLNSNEKHPVYHTFYVTSAGETWSVFAINSQVMAYPVSYNVDELPEVPLIFAESNIITSYISEDGLFLETIPNESEITVKVVDEINAELLEQLTIEEIKKL